VVYSTVLCFKHTYVPLAGFQSSKYVFHMGHTPLSSKSSPLCAMDASEKISSYLYSKWEAAVGASVLYAWGTDDNVKAAG
jgi:hypothetical protein